MTSQFRIAGVAVVLVIISAPALAQLARTQDMQFLEAIRDPQKGNAVIQLLSKNDTTVVNARDSGSCETPLHIVVKRNDAVYTKLLLQNGADAGLRDNEGDTPLMSAIKLGNIDLVPLLLASRSAINLRNHRGETPLMRAVWRRNVALVRDLLAAGADADQVDSVGGKSARSYAMEDGRTPALARLFERVPKRDQRSVLAPKPSVSKLKRDHCS